MMPPLDPVRPDAARPQKVDVVVVGGGIVGAATALCLTEGGHSVMLCEKGVIGGEQSGRNLGWCRTLGRDLREFPLMLEAMRLWADAGARLGADVGFRRNGIVYLCETEQELAKHVGWLESARSLGAQAEVLSSAAVGALLPGAARSWFGAVHAPGDGGAEPQRAATAFAIAAQRAGAVISTADAVRGIERAGGRVCAVVTEKGVVRCDAVVVAGGVWSSQFLGNLGVRFPQLSVAASILSTRATDAPPVQSLTGSGFTTRKRLDGGYNVMRYGGEAHHLTPGSFRFLRDFRDIARSETRVKLRISSASFKKHEWIRSWRNDRPSPFEAERVLEPPLDDAILKVGLDAVSAAFPLFRTLGVARKWAGAIDVTPDALPVISPIDAIPGLFLSSGYSGHGFGIGPAAGRLTADMVAGKAGAAELEPYRFDRFAGGSVRPGPAL